jgi:hypothetical protein
VVPAVAPPPLPGPVLAASPPPAAEDHPPFYRRGLFWSIVGAVAVGAVVAVVVAGRSGGDHWTCADCNWSGARLH